MDLPYSLFTFLWRAFLSGYLCGFPQSRNGHFVTRLPCDHAKNIYGSPGGSDGKESACNAGDSGLISGSGRSAGEGIGYPLQYSWASLVAQLVKNPPAMWETGVRSMVWKDTLQKGKATHLSILAWRSPWTVWFMGSQRVRHDGTTFTFQGPPSAFIC